MSAAAQPAPAIPLARSLACIAASVLLWMVQGLGLNLISANTYQIQGALGATLNETNWLIAAYMAPNVSLTIFLVKLRTQFGLRRFAEVSIALFVAASLLHLFVDGLQAAVPVRFLAGMAASPLSTLGFLYMIEAFAPSQRLSWGLSLALTCSAAAPAVARLISPGLLDLGPFSPLYTLELGLALLALPVVFLLPLTPVPHAKVLHWLDFVSYPLIALGFGALAVVMALGRLYWWFEAPWIGALLALSVLAIALAGAIEINRRSPLIDLRWLFSPPMLHMAFVYFGFRLLMSQQSAGAAGLFQVLGLMNEQSRGFYAIVLLFTLLGGLVSGLVLTPARVPAIHAVALACIGLGAWLSSDITNQTRPENLYLAQAVTAFGGALFLPAAMAAGLAALFRQGMQFFTSFIAMFLFTQSLGGLIGSAFFGTLVVLREKFHSAHLAEPLRLTEPLVAERLRQLAAGYGRVLADGRLLNAEGPALLAQQVTREAYMLAYADAFRVIAVLAFAALGFLALHLLLTPRQQQ